VTTQSAAAAAKAALRAQVRESRMQRSTAERAGAAVGIARMVLALPELAGASVVAAYADARQEPGTGPLLSTLDDRGVRVLLPVQQGDGELDWAWYAGPAAFSNGPHDIEEPLGDRLGLDAITQADVVIVPALAVDRRGNRLGQGGGGYDRALGRTGDALTVAVVHDEEVFDEIPVEPHDISVRAVATPTTVIRCGG
jgi:5-formyltetrahydrofolate cyclo-ligase